MIDRAVWNRDERWNFDLIFYFILNESPSHCLLDKEWSSLRKSKTNVDDQNFEKRNAQYSSKFHSSSLFQGLTQLVNFSKRNVVFSECKQRNSAISQKLQ